MQEALAGLDGVKELVFFILRFFAEEALNNSLFVILNVVKDLISTAWILRKKTRMTGPLGF